MKYICDLAVQRGESLLWLTVLKSNPSARRFYEAFGFQLIGEIPFNTDLAEIGMNAMGFELTRLEG